MTIAVKRYTSTMTGAPTLNGTVGSLITLLDACLKDGFNSQSVSEATQTGGTATFATSSAHGYAVHDVVAISGAGESAWNDEFRVLTVPDTTHFTAAIASDTASPATGTLSAKIAPLGWTKPFSGTDKGAYLPQSAYVQCYLRVQDDASTPTSANGRWAKVRGYETMSDVDTGEGLFPTVAQRANALTWIKSEASDAVARAWWLAGDGGIFYFASQGVYGSSYNRYSGHLFGDINSLKSGDAYSSLILGFATDTYPSQPGTVQFANLSGYDSSLAGHYLARSYTQLGSAVAAGKIGDNAVSAYLGYGGLAYPHPPDNGLLFAPVGVVETSVVRSRALPGLYQPLHTAPLAHLATVTDLPDLPGRVLQAFDLCIDPFTRAQCVLDITGPWR